MQAHIISAVLQKAAQAPALAGIYIKSVSISAARELSHDPIITITWSMPDSSAYIESPSHSMPGVSASIISRPSDTTMSLPREMASPADIEDVVIADAWALGAWDLCRIERAPLPAGADWLESRYGLVGDFGRSDISIAGHPLSVGTRATPEVCEIAARDGYVTWRFVPLSLATPTARRQWAGKDTTLQPDCTRMGEPGGYRGQWRHPADAGTAAEHQYRLGRGNHGNRSKSGQGRKA